MVVDVQLSLLMSRGCYRSVNGRALVRYPYASGPCGDFIASLGPVMSRDGTSTAEPASTDSTIRGNQKLLKAWLHNGGDLGIRLPSGRQLRLLSFFS
jgi:hypothetical protein